jgi:Tfp pilus assembly protein PilO
MRGSAWLRLWYLWAGPAVLIAANAVWLIGIRGAVLGKGSLLAKRKHTLETDVAMLTGQRNALRASQGSLDTLQHDLGILRQDQLGSMKERLVSFLVDVARRTQAAGLAPDRISYLVQREPKTGLVHFVARFDVTGTYEEIRRCINLLESSPQFIVVESVTLHHDETATTLDVNVQLSIGTYFADADTGMLRELGIENLPEEASVETTAPAPKATVVPTPAAPRTDFTSVDAKVMDDLRAAVAGLSNGQPAADEDVFVPPEPTRPPTRRRQVTTRIPADQGAQGNFLGAIGAREVSGGR